MKKKLSWKILLPLGVFFYYLGKLIGGIIGDFFPLLAIIVFAMGVVDIFMPKTGPVGFAQLRQMASRDWRSVRAVLGNWNATKIAIGVFLVLLAFGFYWVEIRPVLIRQQCYEKALVQNPASSPDTDYGIYADLIPEGSPQVSYRLDQSRFQSCLLENGYRASL